MMALSLARFSVVENNGQVSLGLRNQTETFTPYIGLSG